jgi:hypothetical protein
VSVLLRQSHGFEGLRLAHRRSEPSNRFMGPAPARGTAFSETGKAKRIRVPVPKRGEGQASRRSGKPMRQGGATSPLRVVFDRPAPADTGSTRFR